MHTRIVSLASIVAAVVVVVAYASGCPKVVDCGGLSNDPPTVDDGKGTATRSDGDAFNEQASWAPGTSASIDIGLLDMIIAKDETGSDFDTLTSDGAFPICIPLGEQSGTTGKANLLEGNSIVSDATHTGNVLVIALDGNFLVGRFNAELVSSDGASTIEFTDGAFKATRR